jgi:RsiW-degrading membrane proteinase PrsW (M82 family)
MEKSPRKYWPVTDPAFGLKRDRNWLFVSFGCITAVCISLGYLFCLLYKIKSIDVGTVVASSFIDVAGYFAIMVPTVFLLRVYLPIWTAVSFALSLGLVMTLVLTKSFLVREYPNITRDKVSLSVFVAYISAATFEEIIKLIVFAVPLLAVKRLRTVYSLAYLAICSGCTFATIENLIVASNGTSTALTRFVWCTATHTSDCLIGALILAHIKTRCFKDWHLWVLYPLILVGPIALHGTYDVLLFLSKDLRESWMAPLSILVGVVSLGIAAALFYPFWKQERRTKETQASTVSLILV